MVGRLPDTKEVKGRGRLREVAKLFFKLGVIGFGGPAVHIALMQEEVVKKRGWMNEQQFLDLIGATNLIPGPNSTEMAMHIGHERAGWKGLVVAGSCFIIPAVIITAVFALLYQLYGHLPQVQPFMYGIKPAIIAVVAALILRLGRKAIKGVTLVVIGVLAAVAVLIGWNEILVLFACGILGIVIHLFSFSRNQLNIFSPLVLMQVSVPNINLSDMRLFWIFLKIGSVLYGSGYVLFAFLDAELVDKGLLSTDQLVDAIAVGQFTPGPVFSSATFIGWQIGGLTGAIAATIGIFLPSFLFVALLKPLIPFLRKSAVMSAFLDSVNIASIAIILSVLVEISRAAILDWRTIFIALISFAVVFYFRKLNTAYVIFGGAVTGYLLSFV